MEVKMNKDIREYKSKNSLNLTLVQTVVGVIGVIASGFTIFALRRAIGPGTPVPAFVGTAVMLPFALIGDFGPKIQGLSTRTFVFVTIKRKQTRPIKPMIRAMTNICSPRRLFWLS